MSWAGKPAVNSRTNPNFELFMREHSTRKAMILGAGITGLGEGLASGLPIREAKDIPGGICASYHVVPGQHQGKNLQRMLVAPDDGESYALKSAAAIGFGVATPW